MQATVVSSKFAQLCLLPAGRLTFLLRHIIMEVDLSPISIVDRFSPLCCQVPRPFVEAQRITEPEPSCFNKSNFLDLPIAYYKRIVSYVASPIQGLFKPNKIFCLRRNSSFLKQPKVYTVRILKSFQNYRLFQ